MTSKTLFVSLVLSSFIIMLSAININTHALMPMKAPFEALTIDTKKQTSCLAENIYFEAGSEPFEGKVAVAQVTMNRVKDGRFGKDVCGVIFQKNVVMDKVVCQFSWHCDSAVKTRPVNQVAYKESYEVAKKVQLVYLAGQEQLVYQAGAERLVPLVYQVSLVLQAGVVYQVSQVSVVILVYLVFQAYLVTLDSQVYQVIVVSLVTLVIVHLVIQVNQVIQVFLDIRDSLASPVILVIPVYLDTAALVYLDIRV